VPATAASGAGSSAAPATKYSARTHIFLLV
jgi:hypothetical protein